MRTGDGVRRSPARVKTGARLVRSGSRSRPRSDLRRGRDRPRRRRLLSLFTANQCLRAAKRWFAPVLISYVVKFHSLTQRVFAGRALCSPTILCRRHRTPTRRPSFFWPTAKSGKNICFSQQNIP